MGKILKAIKDLPHIARKIITLIEVASSSAGRNWQANWYTNLDSANLFVTLAKRNVDNTIEGPRRWLPESEIILSSRITT